MTEHDPALEAFHRLLADGSAGGQAKVDALVALSQRTVLVPVWSEANDAFRTLINAEGETALPVFTSAALLRAAGQRFGWLAPGGEVPFREVGSRAALRHAVAHTLPFVVVDVASPHSLEIGQTEITPLLSPEATHESQGPYAAVGRLSSSMLQAVKATPPPGTVKAPRTPAPTPDTGVHLRGEQPMATHETVGNVVRQSQPAPALAQSPAPAPQAPDGTGHRRTPIAHVLGERQRRAPLPGAARESLRPPAMDPAGTYGAASRARRDAGDSRPSLQSDIPAGMGAAPGATRAPAARIRPLAQTPPEDLLAAATAVLRNYPEVEWAAYCFAARGEAPAGPALGLRLDEGFRQRVGEIVFALRTAAAENGADVDVILLDDPDGMRGARSEGFVFYPWRRTPSRSGT
jgi:hypothetical protein